MKKMLKCRACDGELEQPFLSLGNSPLSNAYLSKDDLNRMEPHYPLDVYFCEQCFLVQIEKFESPENIFSSDYAYYSSYAESWLQHCQEYTQMIVSRCNLNQDSFVVEIASNDGYLLQYFKKHNIPVLGIEPAANTAAIAIEKGLDTDVAFFDTSYAIKMRHAGKQADLIIGNNVLAHNPELHDFVAGLQIALKPGGIITMEFPHLLQLLEKNQFDTIYHEHFSYFSFQTVQRLFASHQLVLFDVEEIPTHGGSLRILARHQNNELLSITDRVSELSAREKSAGLLEEKTYYRFRENVERSKRSLLGFLIAAKNEGKKIIGYGAPAKGNTLLNYCGIRTDFLDYTVDRNPFKQNKYLPGTRIPIKAPEQINVERPDYVLILPWNIRDEIMQQLRYIRTWGGKFIIPIPEVEVM
jgi:SAM-dependent methyltransferase